MQITWKNIEIKGGNICKKRKEKYKKAKKEKIKKIKIETEAWKYINEERKKKTCIPNKLQ